MNRTAYAVEALDGGNATGKLIVSGCTRDLNPGEAEAAGVPDAKLEADLAEAAAQEFELESCIVEDPHADTGTVVEAIIRRYALGRGAQLALTTTQMYRLFYSLDAQRIGSIYGVETTVAGCPSDPDLISRRTPATYIAEVIRTLQAAHNLLLAENGISLGSS